MYVHQRTVLNGQELGQIWNGGVGRAVSVASGSEDGRRDVVDA